MEIDLNQINEIQQENECFKLEYPNQDVSKIQAFHDWYRNTSRDLYKINNNKRIISVIALCRNCSCYCISNFPGSICTLICRKCNTAFCIGCSRNQRNYESIYANEETICLKGYLQGLYIRTKYRRSE